MTPRRSSTLITSPSKHSRKATCLMDNGGGGCDDDDNQVGDHDDDGSGYVFLSESCNRHIHQQHYHHLNNMMKRVHSENCFQREFT